jgi:hypothetical protein
VGPYVLERRLALGGMAEVWSATRAGDLGGRRFALKVLLEHHARDPKMCAMFADEARLAARLQHPNIVRVEDLVVAGVVHAQVMPLVEGRDLRRVLQAVIGAGEVVPVAVAAAIGRDVARALAYAHAAKADDGQPLEVVHRDVSPHNVMLTTEGRVLLLDFGVALARERNTKTSQGTIKGKLAYMAPEQLDPSRGPVTARADVWSLGVVLWELLAARRLYGSRDGVELVHAVTSEVAEPVTRYRDDVPARLAGLLAAMLTREVEARAASMEAVIEGLDVVVGGAATTTALAAWAAPYVGQQPRRTGVFVAPARGLVEAEDVDETVRPAEADGETAPPTAAEERQPASADRERSTDGAAVGGAPTSVERVAPEALARSDAHTVGLAVLAAPTSALPAVGDGDLADTHPEGDEPVSGSVSGPVVVLPSGPGPGYDVAVQGGQLGPREQLAATVSHRASPKTDEAPTRLDLAAAAVVVVRAEAAPTVPVEVAPSRARAQPLSGAARLEAPTRPVPARDDVLPTVATATPRPSPALAPTAPTATPRPVEALAPTAPLVIDVPGVEQSSIIRPRPLGVPVPLPSTTPRPVAVEANPKRRTPARVAAWVLGGAAVGALLARLWF